MTLTFPHFCPEQSPAWQDFLLFPPWDTDRRCSYRAKVHSFGPLTLFLLNSLAISERRPEILKLVLFQEGHSLFWVRPPTT